MFMFCSGLNTEGLYRVSGNKSEMESMQKQFEQGEWDLPSPLSVNTKMGSSANGKLSFSHPELFVVFSMQTMDWTWWRRTSP